MRKSRVDIENREKHPAHTYVQANPSCVIPRQLPGNAEQMCGKDALKGPVFIAIISCADMKHKSARSVTPSRVLAELVQYCRICIPVSSGSWHKATTCYIPRTQLSVWFSWDDTYVRNAIPLSDVIVDTNSLVVRNIYECRVGEILVVFLVVIVALVCHRAGCRGSIRYGYGSRAHVLNRVPTGPMRENPCSCIAAGPHRNRVDCIFGR